MGGGSQGAGAGGGAPRAWSLHASRLALGARNPIREIVDRLREAKPPEGKGTWRAPFHLPRWRRWWRCRHRRLPRAADTFHAAARAVVIPLSQGDPTAFPGLGPPPEARKVRSARGHATFEALRVACFATRPRPRARAPLAPVLPLQQPFFAPRCRLVAGVLTRARRGSLVLGCPVGTLLACSARSQALADVVLDSTADGYAESSGTLAARRAVSERFSLPGEAPLADDEVIITVGCSQALQMCLTALTDGERSAVLLPRPCFPLYHTICDFIGAEAVYYDLEPSNGWQADLTSLEEALRALGDRAAAVMVNNPGNPTGSVYSAEHLRSLCAVCEAARVPIIADEVYAGMAFAGKEAFTPVAAVRGGCPVLSVGALSKLWLAPGWRLGWLTVHDAGSVLRDAQIVLALQRMAQITIGTAHPVQAALSRIFSDTPDTFYSDTTKLLAERAKLCATRVASLASKAMRVTTQPQGAMYLFLKLEDKFMAASGIEDDREFCQRLLSEEGIVLLPGAAFNMPGYVRVVVCAPTEKLNEAFDRIDAWALGAANMGCVGDAAAPVAVTPPALAHHSSRA